MFKKKKSSETKSLRNMLELNVYVQAKKKSKKKTLLQAFTVTSTICVKIHNMQKI